MTNPGSGASSAPRTLEGYMALAEAIRDQAALLGRGGAIHAMDALRAALGSLLEQNKTLREENRCSVCSGGGAVATSFTPDQYGHEQEAECPACRGTGKADVERDTALERIRTLEQQLSPFIPTLDVVSPLSGDRKEQGT